MPRIPCPPPAPALPSHALPGAGLFAALCAALLAGCAAAPAAPPSASPVAAVVIAVPVPLERTAPQTAAPAPAASPVEQTLAETDRLLRLAPAELAREIARLGEAEDAAPDTPLLLATALAQTRQGVDTARALALVQRLLANPSAPAQALHPLARLLEARLLQQRRLEEQVERHAQQLRDAQRRNDQLSERLEAVRAIERSLTTRPTPPLPPTAPASAQGAPAPRSAP